MRILTLFSMMLIMSLGFSQNGALPVDFEGGPYTYGDFDGGVLTTITNPQSSGINTSANVAQMVKGAGQPWAGSALTLDNPIDFSTNKLFKMKVYSPRTGAKVLLKVENAGDANINFEIEEFTTVANAWEEISFDYGAISTTNVYDKLVFIFDNGVMGDGTANFTFLIDDVVLEAGVPNTNGNLPVDFEAGPYTFEDFSGGLGTVITNPQSSGINTSANVGQVIKGAGDPWAGTALIVDAPIDFSTKRSFKMKVYSPRAGAKVLLKVEDASDGAIFFEKEVTGTVANGWEELTFDFGLINPSNTYNKLVFIFDNGTMGDGSANFTFLIDDIELVSGGPILDQIDLPVTFEGSTTDYTLTDFGGNASSLVADPAGGTNMVAKVIKTDMAATWAGTTIGTPNGFATQIPIAAGMTTMAMRVYSPDAGIPVQLKIEDRTDPTKSCETLAMTTVANAWETLVFDFSNERTGTAALNLGYTFNMASVFFNFDTDGATAGEKTYYFDDVYFGSSVSIDDLIANENFNFYPNPVQDQLFISAKSNIQSVTVFNLMGQEVKTIELNSSEAIVNVSDLAPGVYVAKARIGEVVGSFRIVKQ